MREALGPGKQHDVHEPIILMASPQSVCMCPACTCLCKQMCLVYCQCCASLGCRAAQRLSEERLRGEGRMACSHTYVERQGMRDGGSGFYCVVKLPESISVS